MSQEENSKQGKYDVLSYIVIVLSYDLDLFIKETIITF